MNSRIGIFLPVWGWLNDFLSDVLLQQAQLQHLYIPVVVSHVVFFGTIFLYMTVPLIMGALLNATRGGDLQRSFTDGSAWSTCQCLFSIFLICGAQWLNSVEKKARLGVFVFGAFERRSDREVLLAHCMAFWIELGEYLLSLNWAPIMVCLERKSSGSEQLRFSLKNWPAGILSFRCPGWLLEACRIKLRYMSFLKIDVWIIPVSSLYMVRSK